MKNTLNIRGQNYQIGDFSNLHLGIITKCLMNISTLNFDPKEQSQVGFVLKEIIFPDLPDNLVRSLNGDRYIVLLDIEEISEISTDLSRHYAEKKLAEAKEAKNKDAIAKYEEMLRELNLEQGDDIESLEELKAQIEELKSQVQPETEVAQLKKELAKLQEAKA